MRGRHSAGPEKGVFFVPRGIFVETGLMNCVPSAGFTGPAGRFCFYRSMFTKALRIARAEFISRMSITSQAECT